MAERPLERSEMESLPCGCLMGQAWDDKESCFVFVYEPCSTSCQYYLYVINETKAQGKPVELRSVDR